MTASLWLSALFDADADALPHAHRDRHGAARDTVLDPSDRDLIAAIREGNRGAFDAWYTTHFEALWKFAFRFMPSRDAAKDVVHDVLVSLWVRRATLAPEGTLRAYVYGAVRNRALHLIRQAATAERLAGHVDSAASLILDDGSAERSPADVVESQDLHERLALLIGQLSERQRSALILHIEHDMTASDIGRALGISATAATNLLQRGIANLRRGLAGRTSE